MRCFIQQAAVLYGSALGVMPCRSYWGPTQGPAKAAVHHSLSAAVVGNRARQARDPCAHT